MREWTFTEIEDGRAKLAKAFPASKIEKKAKYNAKDADHEKWDWVNCDVCGKRHPFKAFKVMHVDFVNHAIVEQRLDSVDPEWEWDLVYDSSGQPVKLGTGYALGWMTVMGVRRVETGTGKNPKDAMSDLFKRLAMRHGVALALWAKVGMEDDEDDAHEVASANTPSVSGFEPEPQDTPSNGRVAGPRAAQSGQPLLVQVTSRINNLGPNMKAYTTWRKASGLPTSLKSYSDEQLQVALDWLTQAVAS